MLANALLEAPGPQLRTQLAHLTGWGMDLIEWVGIESALGLLCLASSWGTCKKNTCNCRTPSSTLESQATNLTERISSSIDPTRCRKSVTLLDHTLSSYALQEWRSLGSAQAWYNVVVGPINWRKDAEFHNEWGGGVTSL